MRLVTARQLPCCWHDRGQSSTAQILMRWLGPIRLRPFVMLGDSALRIYVNATDQTGVEDWVKACAPKHGRVDILVNNVGCQNLAARYRWMRHIAGADRLKPRCRLLYHASRFTIMVAAQAGSIINISIAAQRYIGEPQVGCGRRRLG